MATRPLELISYSYRCMFVCVDINAIVCGGVNGEGYYYLYKDIWDASARIGTGSTLSLWL